MALARLPRRAVAARRAAGADRAGRAGRTRRPPTRTSRRACRPGSRGASSASTALAQWVGWLWPYAALAYLLALSRLAAGAPTGIAQRLESPAMSYYERHIFFCLNERDNGEDSLRPPRRAGRLRPLQVAGQGRGLAGPGKVRVNKAGCLDRCAGGPVAVVYPEGVWYTYRRQRRHRRDRRLAPEERPGGRAAAAAAGRRPLMNSQTRAPV